MLKLDEGWTILQGTTTPVFIFDKEKGKYDTDFYLACCEGSDRKDENNKRLEANNKENEKVNRDFGSLELLNSSESLEKEKEIEEIEGSSFMLRDRVISDATSSNLLSPVSESLEKEKEIEETECSPFMLRDRLSSDATSSNLLSPASIERRLGAEREEKEKEIKPNTLEEDSELQSLFPTELIITQPKRKKINKREAWQKWRNIIRNKNKLAFRKYAANIAREERRKESQKSVFDYTTSGLTESEIDILSKGESFCPTTHTVDLDRLKTDIYYFNRKLRLHEQFKENRQQRRM